MDNDLIKITKKLLCPNNDTTTGRARPSIGVFNTHNGRCILCFIITLTASGFRRFKPTESNDRVLHSLSYVRKSINVPNPIAVSIDTYRTATPMIATTFLAMTFFRNLLNVEYGHQHHKKAGAFPSRDTSRSSYPFPLQKHVQIWLTMMSMVQRGLNFISEPRKRKVLGHQEYYGIKWAHIVSPAPSTNGMERRSWRHFSKQKFSMLWTRMKTTIQRQLRDGPRNFKVEKHVIVEGDGEEKEFEDRLQLLCQKCSSI